MTQQSMHTARKRTAVKKKNFTDIDPLLAKPSDDLEQILDVELDELIPDASDVPGGFGPDGSPRPDLMDSIISALVEKKLAKNF